MATYTHDELLICTIARMLEGLGHVAVGASSPIPGAAALLARARSDGRLRLSLLGSEDHNFFTDGGRELFDCAAQGRIDAFFLGGGQIDGEANVNLVGIGDYLYFLVPRVILFREEHSARVLVPRVDFISAPGASADNIYRPGGPYALVTGLCVFAFERERRRFRLASVHPGHTIDEVRANTGFAFDELSAVPSTAPPDAESLALIRDSVGREIAEIYPLFASRLSASAASEPRVGR